ncbi:DNA polymerase III subunit beta [Ferdinandcohnia sp. SAFN-114]|uniref:DNA polymerase III subunit beta n=1 Tax=Ferdinandcohnia sp. SAFN-114 TaxID=3387275 RepID=UPI003F817185
MKFEINRDILSEGLAKVSQVLATSTPLPILQGILLEVEQDSISLTTSDNTQSIQHTIPVDGDAVKVFESGKTVLPKTAVKLVKKSKKVLTFTLDNFLTTITSGKSVFELNCLDPEEYPKLPQIDDSKANLTLNGKQFADFVKKTAFAASTSETRPILQGVLVDIQKDCITLSSTDSHRLGKVTCKWSNQEEIRIVVPAKFLDKAATKIFEPDSDVELFAHEQMILLRNDQTVYYTRLLDGNYPDTSRLLPTEFISVMNIDRKEFLDVILCQENRHRFFYRAFAW